MQYEIKHIHERLGVTVVYVTHDQSEALTMSNRIAVFNDGVVQQLASPAVLYEQPANAFVARFIGENNRLIGTVAGVEGSLCTVRLPSGDAVEALAVNIGSVGSRTTLSLRPERVQIGRERGGCRNRFDARIEELIYLGDHTRVRVQVCGRDDFIVKVPNVQLRGDLAVGKMIQVGWHSEDCRALDV